VSKFGPRLAGAGGFINTRQNAKAVVFVGTFTCGGLVVGVEDGRLRILQEGTSRKFVPEVEHRTFSGAYSRKRKQPVTYITERCVFRLGEQGLELIEIAPGIDLGRDILAQMDFRPVVSKELRMMDDAIFRDAPMGLRDRLLAIPLERRFAYAAEQNVLFINFERLAIRSQQDIDNVRREIERKLEPLGKKVYGIVNYDNFVIAPDLVDPWTEMVKDVVERYYWGVTRYTKSNFLRLKLGNALSARARTAHLRIGGGGAPPSAWTRTGRRAGRCAQARARRRRRRRGLWRSAISGASRALRPQAGVRPARRSKLTHIKRWQRDVTVQSGRAPEGVRGRLPAISCCRKEFDG
jgi:propionate CoA-transferase